MARYDAAVVGLGGMGAACVAHLASRGLRVAGIEQYARGHDQGASTGESRIIRKAYWESPAYVPMLDRAYELWAELETKTQRKLVEFAGILMVGAPERPGIQGALLAAETHDLPLERFDAAQIARRFPGTRPRPDEIGLLELRAGIVFPEAALEAHLVAAEANGAELRFDAPVESIAKRDGAHRIVLADGSEIEATRLVVAPGMWAPKVLADLALPLRVQRNVQIWFEPSTPAFDLGVFPTFFIERMEYAAPLYGFPAMGGTLKAALHSFGDIVTADRPDRRIRDEDVTIVRDALDEWMPGAAAQYVRGKVCTYTLTPDTNFVVDLHPGDPTIAIACGFSGHGYKFCPVIGEIVADMVTGQQPKFDLGFLSIERFGSNS